MCIVLNIKCQTILDINGTLLENSLARIYYIKSFLTIDSLKFFEAKSNRFGILLGKFSRSLFNDMSDRINIVSITLTTKTSRFDRDSTTSREWIKYSWHLSLKQLYSILQFCFSPFGDIAIQMPVNNAV